jgi:hypothetical protein
MSRNILVLLAFLMSAQWASAVTVKGRVVDKSNGTPMEYATVRASALPDSTFVAGVITDPSGHFTLELNKGRYVLEVQYMGFIPLYKNITIDGTKTTVEVGRLSLEPDARMLNEVNVVAEQSTYEMTLDKRVFNVGKDVGNTAGNAIEVLENIPAVSVDVEGNVSLRGDDGVRILIDGKESGLSGMSTQDALRTLQGDMIERVEVITNPSVRYDAEGKMVKGWYTVTEDLAYLYPTQVGNTYYYDNRTGLMAKGDITIDGILYHFDEITGALQK